MNLKKPQQTNIVDEKNENLHNYLHNCVLHWKEKQIRNTSVQQNQLHKNNRRVISNIRCFLFKERMNTKYNPGYKKQSKAKSPKWGSNNKWSKTIWLHNYSKQISSDFKYILWDKIQICLYKIKTSHTCPACMLIRKFPFITCCLVASITISWVVSFMPEIFFKLDKSMELFGKEQGDQVANMPPLIHGKDSVLQKIYKLTLNTLVRKGCRW